MKIRKIKVGFTLAETMVSVFIVGIIAGAAFGLIKFILGNAHDSQMETQYRESYQQTVFYLGREIQSAKAIMIDEDGMSLAIQEQNHETYNIFYEIALSEDAKEDDDGVIKRTENADTQILMEADLRNSKFDVTDENMRSIDVTISLKTYGHSGRQGTNTVTLAPRNSGVSITKGDVTVIGGSGSGSGGSSNWSAKYASLLNLKIDKNGNLSYIAPWVDVNDVYTLGNLALPKSIDGVEIKTISANCFEDCNSLVSLSMNEKVTQIGAYAFNNCSALENVEFSENITLLGEYSFNDCVSLKSLDLSGLTNLSEIPQYGFYNCRALTGTVLLPDHLKKIGMRAFAINVAGISGSVTTDITLYDSVNQPLIIKIPDTVTEFGDYAFFCRSRMTECILPESLQKMGAYTFLNCARLENIGYKIPDGVTKLWPYDFGSCRSLKNVRLGAGCKEISYAFSGCDGLETVEFNDGLEIIGEYAFSACTNLQSTNALPESVVNIRRAAFYHCPKLEAEYDLSNVKLGYNGNAQMIFYNCQKLTLTNAVIPKDTTSISGAFRGVGKMNNGLKFEKGISLPNIELYSLWGYQWGELVLPYGLTTLSEAAIGNLNGIPYGGIHIWIPRTVTYLGKNWTYGNVSTVYIHYQGTEEEWNNIEKDTTGAYLNYSLLTNIEYNCTNEEWE
ncbi:MAG: leucine-rich repeat protein [Clostridiales bacterium]|nr:leucine-rich repeat protein [Clostridiales bacterium]